MRGRKKHYIDIVLNEAKIKRLAEGYTIQMMVNKQMYAITKEVADPVSLKINALKQQITELMARIAPRKTFRQASEQTLAIWRVNAAKARAALLVKRRMRSNV